MTYHAGELLIQTRVGVQAEASPQETDRICDFSSGEDFLKPQQWAIASTVDQNHQVWASLLIGETGFLATSDCDLQIQAVESDDPLWKLQGDQLMGLLVAARSLVVSRLCGQQYVQHVGQHRRKSKSGTVVHRFCNRRNATANRNGTDYLECKLRFCCGKTTDRGTDRSHPSRHHTPSLAVC
jgi:hypothetical protein